MKATIPAVGKTRVDARVSAARAKRVFPIPPEMDIIRPISVAAAGGGIALQDKSKLASSLLFRMHALYAYLLLVGDFFGTGPCF